METRWLPASLYAWITGLAATLDARQRARFVKLCAGLVFARGRRTVASWLRACAAGRDYKPYYYRARQNPPWAEADSNGSLVPPPP